MGKLKDIVYLLLSEIHYRRMVYHQRKVLEHMDTVVKHSGLITRYLDKIK